MDVTKALEFSIGGINMESPLFTDEDRKSAKHKIGEATQIQERLKKLLKSRLRVEEETNRLEQSLSLLESQSPTLKDLLQDEPNIETAISNIGDCRKRVSEVRQRLTDAGLLANVIDKEISAKVRTVETLENFLIKQKQKADEAILVAEQAKGWEARKARELKHLRTTGKPLYRQ
jgi:chromosome segregation ATPase